MSTKFFVELHADEYGNTSMPRAVVEAKLAEKNGRDHLTPVAPQRFVDGWPTGWYRDSYGGWAEIDGPARMLSYKEYDEIINSLSDEAKAGAKSGLVLLRTGEMVPRFVVNVIVMILTNLTESNPIAFYEAVMIARDHHHKPFGDTGEELRHRNIIELDGRMRDITRSVILSATEGEMLDLGIVNPVVSVA